MTTVVRAIAEAVMAVEKAVAVKVMAKAIGMAVEMAVKMVGEAIEPTGYRRLSSARRVQSRRRRGRSESGRGSYRHELLCT